MVIIQLRLPDTLLHEHPRPAVLCREPYDASVPWVSFLLAGAGNRRAVYEVVLSKSCCNETMYIDYGSRQTGCNAVVLPLARPLVLTFPT